MTPTLQKKAAAPKAASKRPVVKTPRTAAEHPVVKHVKSPVVKAEVKPIMQRMAPKHSGDYVIAVGRRKSAVARVRLFPKGTGLITVNDQEMVKYFPTFDYQLIVTQPLRTVGLEGKVDVRVKVLGGGKAGQAIAVRHGISRTLVSLNEEFRKALRAAGFLTRDSRVKERKKYGLKKARRAPQFSKR